MLKQLHKFTPHKRSVWGYVNIAFNRVDADRLEIVGPDRMCAEWIIKNGGAVRYTSNPKKLIRQYDTLSEVSTLPLKLKEIDATDACIMKIGFEHFRGCDSIEKIILNRCKYLENDALSELHYVKDTLKELQVTSCYNFRDDGLLALKSLDKLKKLTLYDFPHVKDIEQLEAELKKALPLCNIITKPDDADSLKIDEQI